MSNLTVKGNASGTGTVIVEAPNTNTNRTITLPDATATLVGDSATQTLTNKSIDAGQLTGALPAISGEALTGFTAAQVGTATAGLAYNAVGSYALLWWSGAGQKGPGSTVAGSSLYPANTYMAGDASNFGYATAFGSPSGTWRLMGETGYFSGGALSRNDMYASVFLRIS